MSGYDPPLVHLPGTKLTPDVVLHRTLNKIDHIEAVTVIIQWKLDSSMSVDWSSMAARDLALAALVMNKVAVDRAIQNDPGNDEIET